MLKYNAVVLNCCLACLRHKLQGQTAISGSFCSLGGFVRCDSKAIWLIWCAAPWQTTEFCTCYLHCYGVKCSCTLRLQARMHAAGYKHRNCWRLIAGTTKAMHCSEFKRPEKPAAQTRVEPGSKIWLTHPTYCLAHSSWLCCCGWRFIHAEFDWLLSCFV